MSKPLEYYFVKKGVIEHVIFNKYTIDTSGVVRNKRTGVVLSPCKLGIYNVVGVCDSSGKQRSIRLCRAITSTFRGKPPTPDHTADHIDRDPNNDTLENLHWSTKSEQQKNRTMSETLKTALVIINDGDERTLPEWVDFLKYKKNSFGREYTMTMIQRYAQKKQFGFSYKEYPDIHGEVWKEITESVNVKGRWEISNMSRVKYITKHAINVLSGERLCLKNGYPKIGINGRDWYCHILSFMTFFPDEYANKKNYEIVLHKDDDRLDFRPHKLRLGTQVDNRIDAYNNGNHDNAKTCRMRCASYIGGILEREYHSQTDAELYLRNNGYPKASYTSISMALGIKLKTAYDRTWKNV